MLGAMPVDGSHLPLDRLKIHRISNVNQPLPSVPRSAFCVIAQGRKEVQRRESLDVYNPDHYLIASVDLPVTSQIVEASVERPYLSLRMEFDPALVNSVLLDSGNAIPQSPSSVKAMDVSPLDAELRDAVLRLARRAESPEEARFLAPLVKREIIYRLLIGNQGARLQHLAVEHIANHCVVEAIERLRREYDKPLK